MKMSVYACIMFFTLMVWSVESVQSVKDQYRSKRYWSGPLMAASWSHQNVCSNDSHENLCPPGLFCTTPILANHTQKQNKGGECVCGGHYPQDIMLCDQAQVSSYVLDCFCATFSESRNLIQVGACFFNCGNLTKEKFHDDVYHALDRNVSCLNDNMCGYFKREGTLCGRCQSNHYPLAYSFDLRCMKCQHVGWNWGRYIMAAYLPLTVFYLFVLFFKINAVSSHLHPVIFYSQFISIPAMSRIVLSAIHTKPVYLRVAKALLSFYGIWNLDFFKPYYTDICLRTSMLGTLALDYAIAVYPLFLMLITYFLIVLYDRNYKVVTTTWKPFRALFTLFRRNWDIRTSVIDVYATFFLLSNIKFLSVTFDLLVPTHVYDINPNNYSKTLVLYYSGDVKYFGEEHLPYAILALFMLMVFVIIPTVIFSLYPFAFFQKFLNVIPCRWHVLHTVMDAFQGCYKDGTEPGSRDCRWFTAIFLVFRPILFLIYTFTLSSAYFALSAIAILLLVLLIINIQPFKSQVARYMKINSTFLIFLAIFHMSLTGLDVAGIKVHRYIKTFYVITVLTGVIPLVYAFLMIFYWIFSRRRFGLKLAYKIKAWKGGYEHFDGNEDDILDSIEKSRDNCSKSLGRY